MVKPTILKRQGFIRGERQYDQSFASGDGLSYDFKLWLSRQPGLGIDKALYRYRYEQKAKQRRRGPRLY